MVANDLVRATTLGDLNRELFEKTGAPSAATALINPSFKDVEGVWDMSTSGWTAPGGLNAFEDLLTYWSILEVACVADAVPNPLPRGGMKFSHLLHTRFVVAECRRRRVSLPMLLRQRIDGSSPAPPIQAVDLRLFQWFLDLTIPLRQDADARALLTMARTPAGETAVAEIVCGVDAPEPSLRFAQKSKSQPDIVRRGFGHFCAYCEELDRLLEKVKETPLFYDAIWHSHTDWPRDNTHIKNAVLATIDRLAQRSGSSEPILDAERLRVLSSVISRVLEPRAQPIEWSSVETSRPLHEPKPEAR